MSKTKIDTSELYEEIRKQPGIGIMGLAKIFGVPYRYITQKLASLEKKEFFVYEDDYSNLYPYTDEDK